MKIVLLATVLLLTISMPANADPLPPPVCVIGYVCHHFGNTICSITQRLGIPTDATKYVKPHLDYGDAVWLAEYTTVEDLWVVEGVCQALDNLIPPEVQCMSDAIQQKENPLLCIA
jgi:hypothetical protein